MRHLVVGLVVFLLFVSQVSADTILVRKRPLKLEEGSIRIHEHGDQVELDSKAFPHTAQIELTHVVRELGSGQRRADEDVRTIRVAAQVEDEGWEIFLDALTRWMEGLDPSSFGAPWAGLAVGKAYEDTWSDLLSGIDAYFMVVCLESSAERATAHRFFRREAEQQVEGKPAMTARLGRDSRPAEASGIWCEALEGAFWGEPSREARTFPSTLEEETLIVRAYGTDRSHTGTTVALPDDAELRREERTATGSNRKWKTGTLAADAQDGIDPANDAADPRPFERTARRLGEPDEGNEEWIVSQAVAAAIDVSAWGDARFVGWRLVTESRHVFAGVMPAADRVLTTPEHGVLVLALPSDRVSPAAQDQFLHAVAERADRSERDLTRAALAGGIGDAIRTFDIERPYMIVCHQDDTGDWHAVYHIDHSSAAVTNPDEVCREIDRRLPTE